MADVPEIEKVELEDRYYHIRFNDPDRFETIRTPDWAARVAGSVSSGAEIRMGKEKDSEDWEIEAVLIEKDHSEQEAREQAKRIFKKINE